MGIADLEVANLQVRGAPLLVTTTEFNASLPGFEIEVEPSLSVFTTDKENNRHDLLRLGKEQIIIPRVTYDPSGSDGFYLKMQVRVWGHIEGGEVSKSAAGWAQTNGSFLRLGPMGQLTLVSPGFSIFKSSSVTTTLGYLGTVYGSSDFDFYFNLNGALAFYEEKETGRKISLVVQYTNGSLMLTGDSVNLLTLGLGIVY